MYRMYECREYQDVRERPSLRLAYHESAGRVFCVCLTNDSDSSVK